MFGKKGEENSAAGFLVKSEMHKDNLDTYFSSARPGRLMRLIEVKIQPTKTRDRYAIEMNFAYEDCLKEAGTTFDTETETSNEDK